MKEVNSGIVPRNHWDEGYENFQFKRNDAKDDVYQFIRKYVGKTNSSNSTLEIGSFPGTYSSELGELGYTIHGIDIQPKNSIELPKWLREKGYSVGDFLQVDFFRYKSKRRFDVVCSFGFIEHFENYLEVIEMHARLVNKEGILMITTPNYRGLVQKFMHRYLAPEDYKLHFIPSMNPEIWANKLEEMNFDVIFKGYFGGMNFWISGKNLKGIKKIVYALTMRVLPRLGKLLPFESLLFSKNCGIVARKAS